jgi:hypothetical protein
MEKIADVKYVTYGRRWARGLNKYEDQGINEFRIILVISSSLGAIIGLGVSIWMQLTWDRYLLAVSLGVVGGFLLGRGFAQIWIPHRWEEMLVEELERSGRSRQHIRETMGFRSEQTHLHPDIFTALFSLGMIKKRRLEMNSDRMYLADVGFNELFIYDVQSAGHSRKVFWKLNVHGAPPINVLSIPYRLDDTTVEVQGIPVVGEDETDFRKRTWIKVSYRVWVQLEIDRERVEQFVQVREPLRVVKDIVTTAAREVLPFQRYEEVLLANTARELEKRVMAYVEQTSLGLDIKGVRIEEIEGSKELDQSMMDSFQRLQLAKDRQAIAVGLSQMDDSIIQLMYEYEGNQAALEYRSRAATRVVEALLATGIPPQQLHGAVQAEARMLRQEGSLPELMGEAVRAIETPVKDTKPDCPEIPKDLTYKQRLQWEAQVLEERLPHVFSGLNPAEGRFEFRLETGQALVIIFPAPQTTRPFVYLDNQTWTDKYRALWDDVYDTSYERTTICKLYHDTLKLLEKA